MLCPCRCRGSTLPIAGSFGSRRTNQPHHPTRWRVCYYFSASLSCRVRAPFGGFELREYPNHGCFSPLLLYKSITVHRTYEVEFRGRFSHGFNCNEAVNFALADWLPYGRVSIQRYKDKKRSPVLSQPAFKSSLVMRF